MMSTEEVKTKFKGPGEWRSQAARLEKEATPPEENPVSRAFKKAAPVADDPVTRAYKKATKE